MRLSLRNGFLLALFGAQIITAVAVGITSEHRTGAIVTSSARLQMTQAAQSAAAETEDYLETAISISDSVKQESRSGTIDSNDDRAVEQLFLTLVASHPTITGVELGRPDGSFIYVRRDGTSFLSKLITMAPTRVVTLVTRNAELLETARTTDPSDVYDPRDRPWYHLADQASDTTSRWTPPYVFFSTGMPGITNAQVLTDSVGKPAGVLGVDVELSKVSSFVRTVPVPGAGSVFVTNTARLAIAVPEASTPITTFEQGGTMRLRTLDELNDPMLSAVSRAEPDTVTTVEVNGAKQFATTQHLKLPGLDWDVVVHAKTDNITGDLMRSARRSRLETFGIGLASLLVAIPLMYGLSRPMRRLYRRATFDQLTGVFNRSHLLEEADRAMQRAHPTDRPLAVAMFDLDGFKTLNDRYGHAVGDEALHEVAQRFQRSLRDNDVLGRLGGDEFAVIMPDTDSVQAAQRVEIMLAAVATAPLQLSVGPVVLRATAGLASLLTTDTAFSELLRRADESMFARKPPRPMGTSVAHDPA